MKTSWYNFLLSRDCRSPKDQPLRGLTCDVCWRVNHTGLLQLPGDHGDARPLLQSWCNRLSCPAFWVDISSGFFSFQGIIASSPTNQHPDISRWNWTSSAGLEDEPTWRTIWTTLGTTNQLGGLGLTSKTKGKCGDYKFGASSLSQTVVGNGIFYPTKTSQLWPHIARWCYASFQVVLGRDRKRSQRLRSKIDLSEKPGGFKESEKYHLVN